MNTTEKEEKKGNSLIREKVQVYSDHECNFQFVSTHDCWELMKRYAKFYHKNRLKNV